MATPNIIWYPMADIIKAYLIEQGVGFDYNTATEWAIATQAAPLKPLNVIVISDEAAEKQYRSIGNGIQEAPVVLITIRSTKQYEGDYKAKEIQEAMDALHRWTWTGDTSEYNQTVMIATANRARGIFPLGQDANKRWVFNLEYSLTIQSIIE